MAQLPGKPKVPAWTEKEWEGIYDQIKRRHDIEYHQLQQKHEGMAEKRKLEEKPHEENIKELKTSHQREIKEVEAKHRDIRQERLDRLSREKQEELDTVRQIQGLTIKEEQDQLNSIRERWNKETKEEMEKLEMKFKLKMEEHVCLKPTHTGWTEVTANMDASLGMKVTKIEWTNISTASLDKWNHSELPKCGDWTRLDTSELDQRCLNANLIGQQEHMAIPYFSSIKDSTGKFIQSTWYILYQSAVTTLPTTREAVVDRCFISVSGLLKENMGRWVRAAFDTQQEDGRPDPTEQEVKYLSCDRISSEVVDTARQEVTEILEKLCSEKPHQQEDPGWTISANADTILGLEVKTVEWRNIPEASLDQWRVSELSKCDFGKGGKSPDIDQLDGEVRRGKYCTPSSGRGTYYNFFGSYITGDTTGKLLQAKWTILCQSSVNKLGELVADRFFISVSGLLRENMGRYVRAALGVPQEDGRPDPTEHEVKMVKYLANDSTVVEWDLEVAKIFHRFVDDRWDRESN